MHRIEGSIAAIPPEFAAAKFDESGTIIMCLKAEDLCKFEHFVCIPAVLDSVEEKIRFLWSLEALCVSLEAYHMKHFMFCPCSVDVCRLRHGGTEVAQLPQGLQMLLLSSERSTREVEEQNNDELTTKNDETRRKRRRNGRYKKPIKTSDYII